MQSRQLTGGRRPHEPSRDVGRVAFLETMLRDRDSQIAGLLSSTSWRITAPLRTLKQTVLRRPAERGVVQNRPFPDAEMALAAAYRTPPGRPAPAMLAPNVVIVAELSLPQCARYRVWQKAEHLADAGIAYTVRAWERADEVRDALSTATLAIFYRTPGFPSVLALIAEAQRLRIPVLFELDDLIFDVAQYEQNPNLAQIDAATRQGVLDGATLYRAALLAADGAIASTEPLAEAMREAGQSRVLVLENAADARMLAETDEARMSRRTDPDRPLTLVYGSGTRTHDADFAVAADGVAAVLAAYPEARLRLIGDLCPPDQLSPYATRIDRLPACGYAAYFRLLADTDINLAPLAPCAFNEAKSNIKWLEAALLGLPTVHSPRAPFLAAVEPGRTSLVAETPDAWRAALLSLARDPARRLAIGAAARAAALARYAPGPAAARTIEVLRTVASSPPAGSGRSRPRVLVANIFFAPQSFGGATIVAEAMAYGLAADHGFEVAAFASWGDPGAMNYALARTEVKGLPVFAARAPNTTETDDPRMAETFDRVLDAWMPDIVHFHCLQGLGVALADACAARNIPYVITLHDAWWLCERQFMVRPDHRYCGQTRIDLAVCATCVPDLSITNNRLNRLRAVLDGAALLLAPSTFHRSLHIANNIDPARIALNANGVRVPSNAPPRTEAADRRLRLAFVGGLHPVKGAALVGAALAELPQERWSLTVVDNTGNLGFASVRRTFWPEHATVYIRPAYTQETIDDFFAEVDVLLFPSQWKESFGLTVREALARDVWVIATEAGGVAEAIEEGVNGNLIPLGPDPTPLRQAIRALLDEPDRLAGWRNPYRDRIVTVEQQAADLAAHLRPLLTPARRQIAAA